jgi:hypothetical protein
MKLLFILFSENSGEKYIFKSERLFYVSGGD